MREPERIGRAFQMHRILLIPVLMSGQQLTVVDVGPVSYTHLDVYKRQALIYLLNDLFGMIFWSIVFYTVNAFVHLSLIHI